MNFFLIFWSMLLFVSVYSNSYAEPLISCIEKSDNTLLVYGQNLRFSSSYQFKWFDFEDGEVNESLSTGEFAQYGSGIGHVYTDADFYNGKISALKHSFGDSFTASGLDNLSFDELYLTLWFKWNSTSDSENRVIKFLRVTSGKSMYNSWPGIWYTGNRMHNNHYFGIMDGINNTFQKNLTILPDKNTWNRLELLYKHSFAGENNGEVTWWINSQISYSAKNVLTRFDNSKKIKNIIFPAMPDKQLGEFWFFVDDVYVASSQSRVEICDSPTWDKRKKCDIQVPLSWSDNMLELLHKGTSSVQYLYVIDSNGGVNKNGYYIP